MKIPWKTDKEKKQICVAKINENIRAVETNQPLTLSLKELKTDCRFMKFYNDYYDIKHSSLKDERKAKKKEYNQRTDVKAKKKEYFKEYFQRPEVRARVKEYKKKPEVKARVKKYYQEYNKKPEVRARVKEYKKKYYQENKEKFNKNAKKIKKQI